MARKINQASNFKLIHYQILVWDGTGLTMVYKRLEGAKFSWPRIEDGVMRLSMAQLSALFEGLAWQRVHSRRVERPRAAQ